MMKHWMVIAAATAATFLFTTTSHAVTIAMVPVGNPGNAPDTRYGGWGSVGYSYQIGKYEVTAGQYTEFLNAVAKADPNGLYKTGPASANIVRSGSSPNFSYSVASDWANRPVNYVSFWDATRFANWLHNGQPTGAQGPGTTEDGAYHDVGNLTLSGRNAGATFVIPTLDEWYKTAYHKNDGASGNYWDYPTASNTAPINTLPDPGNHSNFDDDFIIGKTIGFPYYRTQVGEFANSPSPYGTFDQGGNVWEWIDSPGGVTRGLRGGSFVNDSSRQRASLGNGLNASQSDNDVGFRVASLIPEPGSITLCVVGVMTFMLRRRTR